MEVDQKLIQVNELRALHLLITSCQQAISLSSKIGVEDDALKAQFEQGMSHLQEEIRKRNSSIEKLRGEFQVSKRSTDEVISLIKTEHQKVVKEKQKILQEAERSATSLAKAQTELTTSQKKHETQVRELNVRIETVSKENRELTQKIEEATTAHESELADLQAIIEQKDAKHAEELKRAHAQRSSAPANLLLMKILWQLTSNSVCIPSLLQVCPDIAAQLLTMLIQAMQRPVEQKDYILAMTGVFVNLAAFSDCLPQLLVKHGQNSLVEFLMGHLIVHARSTRNMQLTELCLNLADNLACDREGATQLLDTKVVQFVRDNLSWLKGIPLLDLGLQLCVRVMPSHHLSKQPTKELFWEILKAMEKDKEKEKFKDAIWLLYNSFHLHFKEE